MSIISELLLSFLDISIFSLETFDPYGYYRKPIKEYQLWRENNKLATSKTSRLINAGYIQPQNRDYIVTKKGIRAISKTIIEKMEIPKPSEWDKKWRIVIFDIPESRHTDRNKFRLKLKLMDFEMIQRSVFCHPYECMEQIVLLSKIYGLDGYITVMEVTDIYTPKNIFKIFSDKGLI